LGQFRRGIDEGAGSLKKFDKIYIDFN